MRAVLAGEVAVGDAPGHGQGVAQRQNDLAGDEPGREQAEQCTGEGGQHRLDARLLRFAEHLGLLVAVQIAVDFQQTADFGGQRRASLDGRIHADLEGLDRCTVALQGAGHAVEMAVLIDG